MEQNQQELEKILKQNRIKPTLPFYERPVILCFIAVFVPLGFLLPVCLFIAKRETFNRILPNFLMTLGIMEMVAYALYFGWLFFLVIPELKQLFLENGMNPSSNLWLLASVLFAIIVFAIFYGYFLRKKKIFKGSQSFVGIVFIFLLLSFPMIYYTIAVSQIMMPIYNLANTIE